PDRWRQRAAKLYARAGTTAHADFHYKPPRMRWSTFDRLLEEADGHEKAAFGYRLWKLGLFTIGEP
ncbi:MAG TPA: hypothetical protein VFT29_15325, partial [Gemmatimonadaceae bacterium]|nr:hypothetical protein [Gemmatimonadaceae bacterium]